MVSGAAMAALLLYGLGLLLFYFIIKVAVRNGVREANAELVRAVKEIEQRLAEMKKDAK
ncbi:DUF6019 family protein [Desulfosporosinus fructosivorans]